MEVSYLTTEQQSGDGDGTASVHYSVLSVFISVRKLKHGGGLNLRAEQNNNSKEVVTSQVQKAQVGNKPLNR